MIIHNPILTGSFSVNGADLSTITGSVATSASFDARTTYLESTSSILTAASASQSVTSGSLVAASASLSATSGSLSAASGSFNTRVSALEVTGSALSSSLLTVSGSGYATSGSLNTRVSALEVTGSALSSSLLTVSGSDYATSASLSTASGSFNSRVATIESKYATTGSNTFIGTQVVSGSVLQSGSFTTTGTIIAQTINVQQVTSSVVYSSGSNVFGNDIGNSQRFTGSVLITGSLALVGNITSNGTAVMLGSGSSGYLPKFTGASTVGNSVIQDASTYIDVAGYAFFRRGGKFLILNPNYNAASVYADIAAEEGMGLSLSANGVTQQLYINTSGSIGIGTASPNTLLSLVGNHVSGQGILKVQSATAYSSGGLASIGLNDSDGTRKAIIYSNTDGLQLETGTSIPILLRPGGAATAMTLNTSGNVGIGVTPSAWASPFISFSVGNKGAALSGRTDVEQANFSSNWYFDGASKYIITGYSTLYQQTNGSHIWFQAPSGTAGCAITFTQAMTLDASGRLGIGGTITPGGVLDAGCSLFDATTIFRRKSQTGDAGWTALRLVSEKTTAAGSGFGTAISFLITDSVNTNCSLADLVVERDGSNFCGAYSFRTYAGSGTGVERMRITSAGQFIVGATSMAYANSIGYVAGFMSDFTGQSIVSIARKGQTLASQGMFIGIDSTSSYFWNRDNVAIQLGTNDTTKMTIACTGQVTFVCSVQGNAGIFSGTGASAATIGGKAATASGLTDKDLTLSAWYPTSGTNEYGGDLYLAAGRPTGGGSGKYGTVYIQAGIGNGTANVAGSVGTVIAANNTLLQLFTATSETASPTERMRINSGGDIFIGTCTTGAGERLIVAKSEAAPLALNRLSSDGGVLRFYQDGTEEGNVTVAGTTVSYNSFLGSHWSQLQDGSKPTILKGTILEVIDELCVWENETNDRLPKSKISDTIESKNVYGIFLAWDEEWESTNDFFVAAVGLGYIRVHSSQNITIGDLLQSNGDGTAKIQSDSIMRSSTIAKVVSTQKIETYEDGSYLIAATLHCG